MDKRAYQSGQKAYFDGYNLSDISIFYPEGSAEAEEFKKGFADAKTQIGDPSRPLMLRGSGIKRVTGGVAILAGDNWVFLSMDMLDLINVARDQPEP